MKKIKSYIFMFLLVLVALFAMESRCVLAEGETENEGETEDVNLDKIDKYVVLNPSSSGEAQMKYDDVQYTTVRDVVIRVNLTQIAEAANLSDIDKLEPKYDVCETVRIDNKNSKDNCIAFNIDKQAEEYIYWYRQDDRFQMTDRQDGEKTLTLYFYEVGKYGQKTSAAKTVIKEIVLDTTGPVITITDGEYIYIPKGQTYVEKGATCVDDSGVLTSECTVQIENVTIDLNKSGYQYVRYTATDFFGNEVNAVRKILVETEVTQSNNWLLWVGIGGGLAIFAAFVFLAAWKNKEKQKNQSLLS